MIKLELLIDTGLSESDVVERCYEAFHDDSSSIVEINLKVVKE